MKQPNVIEFYKDKRGKHRWRIKRCGRVVADSAEGYSRRVKAAETLMNIIHAFRAGKFALSHQSKICISCGKLFWTGGKPTVACPKCLAACETKKPRGRAS